MPVLNRIYMILLVIFLILLSETYSYTACTIKLKDGRTFKAEYCQESETRFIYYKYGSKIHIDKDKVDTFSIEKEITNKNTINADSFNSKRQGNYSGGAPATTHKFQSPMTKSPEREKVSCRTCNGTGRTQGWRWDNEFVMTDSHGNPIYKQVQVPTPQTCPVCNGLGWQ